MTFSVQEKFKNRQICKVWHLNRQTGNPGTEACHAENRSLCLLDVLSYPLLVLLDRLPVRSFPFSRDKTESGTWLVAWTFRLRKKVKETSVGQLYIIKVGSLF